MPFTPLSRALLLASLSTIVLTAPQHQYEVHFQGSRPHQYGPPHQHGPPHRYGPPPLPFAYGPPNLNGPSNYSDAQKYLGELQRIYETNTYQLLRTNASTQCDPSNIGVRRAWDDISDDERAEYIRAVRCLSTKPSRTDPAIVPGARNWVDDFVWQHINQTNYIHVSGLLLPFHRQFMWSWEQSLRNECGYKGYLPYWPWERHADNQSQSPIWQPGPNSFGTDGTYIPHGEIFEPFLGLPQPLNFTRAAGTGGGCVTDGAFGNHTGWTLNIGPVTPVNDTLFGTNSTPDNLYGQHYNPRCLKRDWLQAESTTLLNWTALATLMQQDSIHTFHPVMENGGVHLGGHFFIGADGSDIYASPNEPAFWLHHSQIDRLWTIWQAQDFAARGDALDGTVTISNIPPSENATLDTIMKMGVPAGGDLPIRVAMSATGNEYCYMYA